MYDQGIYTFNSSGGSGVTSVGGGVTLVFTSSEIKSLVQGSGVTITDNGQTVTIAATGTDITVVANFSALPPPNTVPNQFFWASNSQGTKWLPGGLGGTYYSAGLYYSNGATWEFMDVPYQASQSAVNAGIVTDQFVTPATLKNSTQWATKVDANAPITGATNTKITYDSKGLVTSGTQAALNDLSDVNISSPTNGQAFIFNGSKWINQTLVTGVSSVFGRTGAVIAQSGDYTTTLVPEGTNLYYTAARFNTAFASKTTSDLTEGTNLYFTNARAIGSTLTGYVSSPGVISPSDSVLTAIEKLNGNIGALVTGVSSVTGTTNRITASPTTGNVIIDISASYVGQASITTVGAITTGTWSGSFGTVSGANLTNLTAANISAGTAGINITGNSATATALQTARNINGVSFNGTADITVTAAAGTLTGATLNATVVNSSLTSVGTLVNLTVTNPITGSITGNSATVTTNANLTGPITSVGNATSIASQTGTSTTFAMSVSPVFSTNITTPIILGGSAVGSFIEYRSTSAAGTSTVIGHTFTGGTNGGTTIASMYNNGNFNIGDAATAGQRLVQIGQDTAVINIGSQVGATGNGAIYMATTTPSNTNYCLSGQATSTFLNGNTNTILSIAGSNKVIVNATSVSITPAASATGTTTGFSFTQAANTNQTASTEAIGVNWNTSAIIQHATGALTLQRNLLIQAPTYSFVAASTLTDAVTFEVSSSAGGTGTGNPTTGTNATITRAWAARFMGNTYADKLFAGATGISPTAFIDTAASTTGAASMRIRSGVAPTSPNDGDFWNDSTLKNIITYSAGINQRLVGSIFTQTADKTFSNTTTETSLIGTGSGTATLPANFWTVGKTVVLEIIGIFSRGSGNFLFKAKLGASTVATSQNQSPGGATNNVFFGKVFMTCRSTGAAGTIITSGYIYIPNNAAANQYEFANTTTNTIDTTVSDAIDITMQMSAAAVGNSITSQILTIKVL